MLSCGVEVSCSRCKGSDVNGPGEGLAGGCPVETGSRRVIGLHGEGSLQRYQRSLSIVYQGRQSSTGLYFLRNLLLQMLSQPKPSTCTTYWSNWQISMMRPVLSHLVGCGPVWLWMGTWSPTARGGSLLVCSVNLSAAFVCLIRRVCSLLVTMSLQVGCGL